MKRNSIILIIVLVAIVVIAIVFYFVTKAKNQPTVTNTSKTSTGLGNLVGNLSNSLNIGSLTSLFGHHNSSPVTPSSGNPITDIGGLNDNIVSMLDF